MKVHASVEFLFLIAPFFVLPWTLDSRLEHTPESVERLVHGPSPAARDKLLRRLRAADPNASFGGEPLLFKVGINPCDPEMVKLLLARGADPNRPGTAHERPLIAALKKEPDAFTLKGDKCEQAELDEIVLALLKHGADPNAPELPLGIALDQGRTSLFAALLKAGADPNAIFEKAFYKRDNRDRTGEVRYLIEAGAFIDPQKYLWPSLELNLEVFEHLLKQQQTLSPQLQHDLLDRITREPGSTPIAEEAALALVLKHKPNLSIHFEDGETVLTRAVKYYPNLLEPLLNAGADPNFKNKRGVSPLAALFARNECESSTIHHFKLLLDHGANANERTMVSGRSVSYLQRVLAKSPPILDGKACASLFAKAQSTIDAESGLKLEVHDGDLYKQVSSKIAGH